MIFKLIFSQINLCLLQVRQSYSDARNSQSESALPELYISGFDVKKVDQVAGDEQQCLRVQHVQVVTQHTVIPERIAAKQQQK